ncbi:ANKRD17 [Symbiodinium natans]|uniref:ANKRD17 protein n=1 Tax=Symbiodinium natans TaxID=878477 RepID=A0A812MTK3_9DINO|nr:ANKRD17 [Symbiodinium natans]
MTPLCHAASAGHLYIVELLLDAGADGSLTPTFGMSALEHAASHGHAHVVDLLCCAGAPYDSCLLHASECGHWDIVRMLVLHCAESSLSKFWMDRLRVAEALGHLISLMTLVREMFQLL